MILKNNFYQKNTLDVAKNLLGCVLVRESAGWRRRKTVKGVITETEAYIGEDDLACHASKGRTPRTEVMYGKAGRAYVYLVYGIYHCLNAVTEKEGFPAAVLIRGIKIRDIDYKKTNGPGKLCRYLNISRKLNGWDLTKGEKLWIEKPAKNISKKAIMADRRIGIDYARHCRHYLWRFRLDERAVLA